MTNLGLEFNKRVYRNISKGTNNKEYRNDNIKLNSLLTTTKLKDLNPDQLDLSKCFPENEYFNFSLTTAGQGFLIGTGNEHGTGAKLKINNKSRETHEFKMGFHFDHSTGIPFITGHNLKGRLRSFFPIAYSGDKKKKVTERLIQDINKCINKNVSGNFVNELQNAIFEGKNLPSIKKDIFLGAYPSKSYHDRFSYNLMKKNTIPTENKIEIPKGTFLFEDTLAYHKHPLKDPNPIKFLKILPDVEIKFQFRLFKSGGLTAKEKKTLFEFLLKKYGAGAKTSSGYGQFKKETVENETVKNESPIFPSFDNFNPITLDKIEESIPTLNPIPRAEIVLEDDSWLSINEIKQNDIIQGTVIEYSVGNAKVKLHIKGQESTINLQGRFDVNQKLKIKVKETLGSLKKGTYQISKIIKI